MPPDEKTGGREGPDEAFDRALHDPDNAAVLGAVAKRFAPSLDGDARRECAEMAVLRALRSHDPSYRQKFTCTLHRYMTWECRRAVRDSSRRRHRWRYVPVDSVPERPDRAAAGVFEAVGELPRGDARLIRRYYLEGLTLREIARADGCSHETVARRLRAATAALRAAWVGPDGV